jgi:2-hydroxychromene-2-carboxylate isomerase
MTAVWVQERDISDPETLIVIANEQGLDGTSMFTRVEDNSVMKELDDNGQEAIDRNVFGTPTWIYKEELFWGQDRLEFLTRAVESSD